MDKMNLTPAWIYEQYQRIAEYKAGLGERGIKEQTEKNERFYVGDQWYGANISKKMPLVRHNVIKRIGEYKQSVIGSSPLSVRFSAAGVPNTVGLDRKYDNFKSRAFGTDNNYDLDFTENETDRIGSVVDEQFEGMSDDEQINFAMDALSDYYKVTAERLKFNNICSEALRRSFVSGTGVIYTWWNPEIETGLYADDAKSMPIKGDIECEVLDIENIYFGDPNETEVQKQPFIIIAQRMSVDDAMNEARMANTAKEEIENIKPDDDFNNEVDYSQEISDSKKCTVLTFLFKTKDENNRCVIHGVKVTKKATVREEWSLDIRLYPLDVFRWEQRKKSIYGESEVTYLIPNQISINRMLTAQVWAVMSLGMPIMTVNNDVVNQAVTNAPGQVIRISGDANDMRNAIGFVQPPNFSPNFDNAINSLLSNTMQMSGANDAALGDLRPDNTSAVVAVREAAMMPMQTYQNRYYQFIENIARIWAEFWIFCYGERQIKIEDKGNSIYIPFDGDKYKTLVLSVNVDVGASTLWSESQSITTLGNLLQSGVITPLQYLERLPKGIIPELGTLIKEIQAQQEQAEAEAQMQAQQQYNDSVEGTVEGMDEESKAAFLNLSRDEQLELLRRVGAGNDSQ